MKAELVAKGMAEKLITYTPRYNAFIQGGAYNTNQFRTDGEGIDVVEYVVANSPYGVDAIDYVHYMMCRRSASFFSTLATRGDGVRSYAIDHTPSTRLVTHRLIPAQMTSTRRRGSRTRRSSTSFWTITTP